MASRYQQGTLPHAGAHPGKGPTPSHPASAGIFYAGLEESNGGQQVQHGSKWFPLKFRPSQVFSRSPHRIAVWSGLEASSKFSWSCRGQDTFHWTRWLEAPANPAPTPLHCPRSPRHQRELRARRQAGETPAASQSAPCELLSKGEGDISRRPSIPCDSREHRLPRRYRGAQETRLCRGRGFLIPRPSRFSARGRLTKRCLSLGPAERFSARETLEEPLTRRAAGHRNHPGSLHLRKRAG